MGSDMLIRKGGNDQRFKSVFQNILNMGNGLIFIGVFEMIKVLEFEIMQ